MNVGQPDEQNHGTSLGFSSGKLLALSIISASIYGLISLVIFHYYHDKGISGAFESDYSLGFQLGIGIVSGGIAAAVISLIMYKPPVSEVLSDFFIIDVISKSRFSLFDNSQLSLFAGTGEELLFRGAIQPLLGNVLTSVIFVGIHGYFKFKSFGQVVFGIMMFGLSFMLGLLFEYAGLIAAITAHTIYDIIMLQIVQKKGLVQKKIYHF